MPHAMAKSKRPLEPNSSMLKIIDATGQLTTPQNSAIRPSAAPKPGLNPKRLPKKQPKVEPMKKVGTISPPLYPVTYSLLIRAASIIA